MLRGSVVTNRRCNQACGFCDARRASDDLREIQPAALRARIDALIADGARELVLTGGEPGLRNDLVQLVSHVRSRGAAAILDTNATLIDDERARALAAAGLTLARVHLPAWDDDADTITRDPGGSLAARRGLRALAAAGVPVVAHVPVVAANLTSLPALLTGLAAAAPSVRRVEFVVPFTGPDPAALAPLLDAVAALLDAARRGPELGLEIAVDPATPLAPCLFASPSHAAELVTLSRHASPVTGLGHTPACTTCVARGGCPGLPLGALARGEVTPRPIHAERVRRRLTMVGSVPEQIARELVSIEAARTIAGELAVCHTVRINFHCNQACEFCFVSTHLPGAAESEVRAAIVEAGRRRAIVALSGGEPTLNPLLLDYVALARRAGAREIELQTNATRLDIDDRAHHLAAAGVDTALVSLHGATAATSDAMTRAPGTFARTVLGLDALARTPILTRVNFVMTASNHHELPDLVRLVAARWPGFVVTVSFVASHTDLVPRTPALIARLGDVAPALARALDLADELGVRITGFESMCGVPACFVPERHRHRALARALPAGDTGGEFVKDPACSRCAADPHCWGLRRGYAELHGTAEVSPFPRPADQPRE